MSIDAIPHDILAELAWLARKHRLTHPRGKRDSGGRWYPDETAEGGKPRVRCPSRTWPWSYMTACRSRAWCAQLPHATLAEDAAVGLDAIQKGDLTPTNKLARRLAELAAPTSA